MPRWPNFNIQSRKAQFFIISTVIVAISLASISSLFREYTRTDLSKTHGMNEGRVLRDVKGNVKEVLDSNCPERRRNFRELEKMVEGEMLKRGISVQLENRTSLCTDPVNISIGINSSDVIIREEFQYP